MIWVHSNNSIQIDIHFELLKSQAKHSITTKSWLKKMIEMNLLKMKFSSTIIVIFYAKTLMVHFDIQTNG